MLYPGRQFQAFFEEHERVKRLHPERQRRVKWALRVTFALWGAVMTLLIWEPWGQRTVFYVLLCGISGVLVFHLVGMFFLARQEIRKGAEARLRREAKHGDVP